jgi:hypothetical protein
VASLTFGGPQDSVRTLLTGNVVERRSTPHLSERHYGGIFTNTTQFDGFSIIPASGNITGRIQVFGYRDS